MLAGEVRNQEWRSGPEYRQAGAVPKPVLQLVQGTRSRVAAGQGFGLFTLDDIYARMDPVTR